MRERDQECRHPRTLTQQCGREGRHEGGRWFQRKRWRWTLRSGRGTDWEEEGIGSQPDLSMNPSLAVC